MPSTLILLSLFLVLSLSKRETVDAVPVNAVQSGPYSKGSTFPAAMIYNKEAEELHLLNNQERLDGSTRCLYDTLHTETLTSAWQFSFGTALDVCHNLVADGNDHIYLVGHSQQGGLLEDLESSKGPLTLANNDYYGILLDISAADVPELHGGGILYGSDVVYTLAVATDSNGTVYTVSLHSDRTDARTESTIDANATNATIEDGIEDEMLGNPSKVFPVGSDFTIVVEAFDPADHSPKVDPEDNKTMILGDIFPQAAWNRPIIPEGESVRIANIAGVLVLHDTDETLLVAGSTNGYGAGLGIANSVDETDMDGFVVKLVKETGEFYNQAAATSGKPASYRVQSRKGEDEYIYGMCQGADDPEFVYLTGSSTGRVNGGFFGSDSDTRAFLIKLNVTDMKAEWKIDMGANPPANVSSSPAHGIACAVFDYGRKLYMAGHVLNGGTMRESTSEKSLGGSDVFIAKIDTEEGDVEWMRQIGSSGDEELAPRGGLILTADHNAILFGQTNGNLYRERHHNESESVADYFVTVLSPDGNLTEQATDALDLVTEAPTMAPTTIAPTTEAPTTAAPTELNHTAYTFDFASIKLHLEGVNKYIDSEAGRGFENVTKNFYEQFYKEKLRRRLQEKGEEIHHFKTTVTYWGGSIQDGDNVVTYNQTISFKTKAQDVDHEFAKAIIVEPLQDEADKEKYIKELQKSHETFAEASAVAGDPFVPAENRPKNAAGNVDMNVFIFIAAGLFAICICWGLFTSWQMDRKAQETEQDYDEKNDIDRPEAPLDTVEMA